MQAIHGINVFNPMFFGFGEANMKNKEKVINPIGDDADVEGGYIWDDEEDLDDAEDNIDTDINDWNDEDEEDGYDTEWDGDGADERD